MKYQEIPCKQCEKKFVPCKPTNVYCSRSCSAKQTNRVPKRLRKIVICPMCNKDTGRFDKEFCDRNCRLQFQIAMYLLGIISGSGPRLERSFVRHYLVERSGLQCEAIDSRTGKRCEESRKYNGKTILQLDHIDGDWRNNRPENVRYICPTCHALTPTFAGRNVGNGRSWRGNYTRGSRELLHDTI